MIDARLKLQPRYVENSQMYLVHTYAKESAHMEVANRTRTRVSAKARTNEKSKQGRVLCRTREVLGEWVG